MGCSERRRRRRKSLHFPTHKLFIDYVMSAVVIRHESKFSYCETGNVCDMHACKSRGYNSALLKSMGLIQFILVGGKLHLERKSERIEETTRKAYFTEQGHKKPTQRAGLQHKSDMILIWGYYFS